MSKVKLYLYPGRDAQSNYRAFHIQNFVYVGSNPGARDIFFNNLLVELLQRGSIVDFNLHIMFKDSNWVYNWVPDTSKQQAGFTRIKCVPWVTTVMCDTEAISADLLGCIKQSESALDVVYLDNIEDLEEKDIDTIMELIVDPSVFVWIAADSVDKIPTRVLEAIMLRFAGPISAEDAMKLFGRGLQISEKMEQNMVLACKAYNQIPEVLYAPFRPNTLLSKIIKAYSVWRDLRK